ncbi:hypothetical protein GPECTOR_110g236 [Gonium pectorale]|uniref:Uncharacterized protein n=1 Tax=Gonium pectorale TaxID=33097 RepID=A0A150FZA2_GONPE|nr:hypothetical protein GPECTOR_110g236 [Gonium pectorale]|eukprot:KXZ42943.1 hypothetical protein GPECTOR_110g236 [Gonium pectorale]
MASATTEFDSKLHSIVAKSIGSESAEAIESALVQGRAYDRYHRGRVVQRKCPPASAGGEAVAETYGLYLGKGALLYLDAAAQEGGETRAVVRLIHCTDFACPHMTPAARRGEEPPPKPAHLDWTDPKRPKPELFALAPRTLGPLPPDLLDSLLPLPLAAGGGTEAAVRASHAFAAWLAGLPLPQPLTLAEAWARYETFVRDKPAPTYSSEEERQWLEDEGATRI